MKGVEPVFLKKQLIACVYRKSTKVKDVEFFTGAASTFQVGIHNGKKNLKLAPHVHTIKKPFKIDSIAEVIYVQSGRVRVNLYTKKGATITHKVLKKDDSILISDCGHGVDFLTASRILIIKQGPFENTIHEKIYFKDK